MRQFLSKAIAGGLSAGVVLLWCPLLFPADSLTSWLVRGVAWTVLFEILLHSLAPFEQGVWEAAGSRFGDESKRRALWRAAPVASIALVAAVVMLAVGLHRPAPPGAEAARPVKVVRVTKLVRPVTVKRVIERAPASSAGAPVVAAAPASAANASAGPAAAGRAPAGRASAPSARSQTRPERQSPRQPSRSGQGERAATEPEAAPKGEIGDATPEGTTVCSGSCADPPPAATGSSLQ